LLNGKVGEMVRHVRDEAIRKRRARERRIRARKDQVLELIGEAAVHHSLPVYQDRLAEQILLNRLSDAQSARVSEAECMAQMALHFGDFQSDMMWRIIKTDSNLVLWRGHVVRDKLAKGKFHHSSIDGDKYIRYSVHVVPYGFLIGEIFIDDVGVVSAGMSVGDSMCVTDAFTRAYTAHFLKSPNNDELNSVKYMENINSVYDRFLR